MGLLGSNSATIEAAPVRSGQSSRDVMSAPVHVPAIRVCGIDFSYGHGQDPVLTGITLPDMDAGSITSLIGPNGAGKSTLLRCIAGLEECGGEVVTDRVLYLPQDPPPASSLTVFGSVMVARQQVFKGLCGLRVTSAALRDVSEIIEVLGLGSLAARTMAQLSGGQRQLVSFAQAVIRRPSALLLDEPTSALDLRNQLLLLDRIRQAAKDVPAAVIMTVHDLGQVARFSDQVVVLSGGRVHSVGDPRDVITQDMLREVYGVNATVYSTADGGIAVEASQALL